VKFLILAICVGLPCLPISAQTPACPCDATAPMDGDDGKCCILQTLHVTTAEEGQCTVISTNCNPGSSLKHCKFSIEVDIVLNPFYTNECCSSVAYGYRSQTLSVSNPGETGLVQELPEVGVDVPFSQDVDNYPIDCGRGFRFLIVEYCDYTEWVVAEMLLLCADCS